MRKIPPQMIEIEESILSGCLLYPEIMKEAVDLLHPSDFYRGDHQRVFETIVELNKKNEPVDLVTVASTLAGAIENIGSKIAYLTDQPIPINVEPYAKKIINCRQLRDMQAAFSTAINACYDQNADYDEVLSATNQKLNEIDAGGASESFISMKELTLQSSDRYEAIKDGAGIPGVMTGYPTIDRLTGGLKGSKLIIVAARPGMGKTAFMCNMIGNMACHGDMTGVFSIEMDKEDLDDRWNASEAGINSSVFHAGYGLDKESWRKLTSVFSRKFDWPVLIDDTGGLKINELKRRARRMVRMGAKVIFIDQLSEIRPGRDMKSKAPWEINTHHVEELGFLKKELKIPIVLLAQLNRELEKRNNKKPMLSDLKNTGMLEEKADIVLLGYRKFPYTRKPEDLNHAEWEIAKHRGGATWNIHMHWQPKFTRFVERALGV